MPRRPAIGQPAPRFELPAHGAVAGSPTWSLDDELDRGFTSPQDSDTGTGTAGAGRAVVLIFHRHIH
ncbi:MAG: hypothetical protein ABJH68_00145 [Ilumatobacter sp.]|uniref:hypothetical protein n=1 Tax=Ilumatobacter sp. TaxID=1967498 RepID=UPI003298AFE1